MGLLLVRPLTTDVGPYPTLNMDKIIQENFNQNSIFFKKIGHTPRKPKKKFLLDELSKDQTNRTKKQKNKKNKNKKIDHQVEVEENQDLGMSWGVWI
jgi:hypothetical protein